MLGLRFDRLVSAAVAGGGLTLTACPGGGQDTDGDTDTDTDSTDSTDSDEPTTGVTSTTEPPPPPPPPADVTPPVLLTVNAVDPQILRLTFTEAVAPVDLVNPKRFRLSVGLFYENKYYGYSRTNYNEPALFNHNTYCYEKCYYECYEQCYDGAPLELDILDVLADATDPAAIVLLLENPITPSLCSILEAVQSSNPTAGLLLHYANGGASQITDLAGLPLAATGATWVKVPDQSYLTIDDQQFPEQNPLLPIPCPF